MPINYPTSLDTLTNPTSSDTLDSPPHATQHANANDAIEALEAKLGITSSTPTAGTILRGTSTGGSTWITAYRFLVHCSADITDVTGDGTAYDVVFDTAISNPGTVVSLSTGVFTAPVAGLYQLSAVVSLLGLLDAHTLGEIVIVTSNRTYRLQRHRFGQNIRDSVGGLDVYSGSILADLDASDTAKVQVSVSGSTKTVDIDGGTSATFFSGHYVGPIS